MAEKLKYATLSKTLNRWNFSGGLRFDYTTRYFELYGSAFANRISNYIYLHRIDSIIDPETMTPRKQLIFYSFSKRLRNPVIINT